MRTVRTTVIGLLLAGVALAAPGVAVGARGEDPPSGAAAAVGERDARAALEAVEEAFRGEAARARRGTVEEHSGRQLTPLLRDLRLGIDELDGAERERAEAYLARPDGDPAFPGESQYGAGVSTRNDCTVAPTPDSRVCVHWATTSRDAPPLADGDGDGVPDQVETTRDVLNSVWTRVVTEGGYRAPRPDLSSENSGPDGRIDVYLADLGAAGLYGYCASDDPATSSSDSVSAFCALDDDFSVGQFGGKPLQNLRVTVAHEFFHSVQYAYDWTEDVWLLEGTAAWIEDELYDKVNDNLQYLATDSPLSKPDRPLDRADDNPYGNWIFWRYLSEQFPAERGTGLPLVIREVINRAGKGTTPDGQSYSTQALTRTLDVPLPRFLTRFASANRRPGASYDEGASYRAAPTAGRIELRNRKARTFGSRLPHLATDTVRVVPGRALKGKRWKLRVAVQLPRRSFGYAAAVTTFRKGGGVSTKHVRLAANGDGTAVTTFGRARVRRVEVTLTNASVRYDCWQGSAYACQGDPKDDGRVAKATFRAVR
jgi:hypothetical protein